MSDGAPKAQAKSLFHFSAGLASGLLSAVLLQPIDLLKTRVQQSGHHSLTRAIHDIRLQAQARRGTTTLPSHITALWRGTVPSALRTGFGSAVYFTTLNTIRQSMASRIPFLAVPASPTTTTSSTTSSSSSLAKLSNTGNLLAGSLARAFAGLLLMPLTVIKVRYESSLYNYASLPAACGDILRRHGPAGFFAGFGATAVRDAPYAGLYILFYEQSKRRLSASRWFLPEDGKRGVAGGTMMGFSRAAAINFSSALSAGVICSVLTNPFDAVKTRIQLQPGEYKNMWAASRKMLAEEGVRSMWDGLALRMSRKALSSALAWTVYEELVRRAEGSWGGRVGAI
ncbi:mitochondrial carrier [Coniochaeta ligniaria NRRL 30616]|uniref:Mitochondrial glycine transporter n=1 Tax=Coniochaeta ligniaria NRRL 30616 TaxID=1408157 RepID=A0A1J7J4W2_9PEZI|nr:mitochondrial carrier [Coniochaeta ligniaria NRRL 30616]